MLNTAQERVDLVAQESLLVLTDVLPGHSFMKVPVSSHDPYSAAKFDLFLEFFLDITVKHEQIKQGRCKYPTSSEQIWNNTMLICEFLSEL